MEQDREYGLKFCDTLMKIVGANHHDLPNIIEQLTRANLWSREASLGKPELLRRDPRCTGRGDRLRLRQLSARGAEARPVYRENTVNR